MFFLSVASFLHSDDFPGQVLAEVDALAEPFDLAIVAHANDPAARQLPLRLPLRQSAQAIYTPSYGLRHALDTTAPSWLPRSVLQSQKTFVLA